MPDDQHANQNHFPPEFLLRNWIPAEESRVWFWDRVSWSANRASCRPDKAQRGTVRRAGVRQLCSVLGDRAINSRWNRALENEASKAVRFIIQCQPEIIRRVRVIPLQASFPRREALVHLIFSAPNRVHGHPPVWQTPALEAWYLEQLEARSRRDALIERLCKTQRIHLVWLNKRESHSLAITDWGALPLSTTQGDILLLPISPWLALCAAEPHVSSNALENFFSRCELPELSEAHYGTVACFLPRPDEDPDAVGSQHLWTPVSQKHSPPGARVTVQG